MSETISTELDYLSCEAIGYCLDIIAQGEELWPTLFTQDMSSKGQGQLLAQTFQDDGPDACLEAAHTAARALDSSHVRYAIAYDGAIQEDFNQPASPALILVFGERGMASAYTACVPYDFDDTGDLLYGDPIPGGEEPLALS